MSGPDSVDYDAEQEVDLGRYGSAIAARWWLPLLGLVLGAALGYLLSLGGTQVYRAQAVVYLGQPYSPSGGSQLQSLQTNPSTVRQIVKAESNVRRVAADAGLRSSALRSGVSATPVAGNIAKLGQTPLVAITVKGRYPAKIARAANELARIAVKGVSGYVDVKIGSLEGQVQSDQEELDAIDQRLAQIQRALPGVSGPERLSAIAIIGFQEQRRAIVNQDLLQTRPLLSQARNVERGRVLTRAVASKATARSRRNSVLVGALLGVLLGLAASLLWEPALRLARRPAV